MRLRFGINTAMMAAARWLSGYRCQSKSRKPLVPSLHHLI